MAPPVELQVSETREVETSSARGSRLADHLLVRPRRNFPQSALEKVGQGQITRCWGDLSEDERSQLSVQIESLGLGGLREKFEEATATKSGRDLSGEAPKPVSAGRVCSRASLTAARREEYVRTGLGLIAEGKVGVILLAGGQGTRLGTKLPKGCVDLQLPGKKTLFQIQAERILDLQKLAAEAGGGKGHAVQKPIMWYIMLSDATRAYTESYFRENSWFGLKEDQVFLFNQGKLPCVSEEGKVLLETKGKIAESPDGNGGIYKALRDSGCLESMERAGVEALDCYCVDNILAKIADPLLIGYCKSFGADLCCRTLAKSSPGERVGVFVERGEGVGVVEYSELDPEMSAKVANAETGELYYNWSNICMQYYSKDFLTRICCDDEVHLEHHLASKTIPTVDGPVPGVKMEQFIFDVFHYAKKSCLLEVMRDEEFAPIKSEIASATTALTALEGRWSQSGSAEDFNTWWYLH
mmetsp:Transcript_11657/g.32291  ORF Transcript_11657/g.32291 Transcript_11657/m.32291 type:complete len:470 (-) Transcript_11657:76-1485(-)